MTAKPKQPRGQDAGQFAAAFIGGFWDEVVEWSHGAPGTEPPTATFALRPEGYLAGNDTVQGSTAELLGITRTSFFVHDAHGKSLLRNTLHPSDFRNFKAASREIRVFEISTHSSFRSLRRLSIAVSSMLVDEMSSLIRPVRFAM